MRTTFLHELTLFKYYKVMYFCNVRMSHKMSYLIDTEKGPYTFLYENFYTIFHKFMVLHETFSSTMIHS